MAEGEASCALLGQARLVAVVLVTVAQFVGALLAAGVQQIFHIPPVNQNHRLQCGGDIGRGVALPSRREVYG